MISTARLLKEKSPSPQENKGWLELPNGQRFQPTPAQAYFAP
ncbi:phage-related protein [Pectobacterium atrosepticum SCRI1043]|uniref:Phage-related protein n=2 Tax=Pectobacteriaceae TaxID=1903410 RepID=Q6D3W0_PECAS|nr:phage filamentation protein Fil family protein [Pectobacterium atrosepticum]AIK13745.1 phage-related protein [Pectobacterium atrosepticum]CAG75534.1 phage-related protein [Pectobacterium atrosepticum SCRI1043]